MSLCVLFSDNQHAYEYTNRTSNTITQKIDGFIKGDVGKKGMDI